MVGWRIRRANAHQTQRRHLADSTRKGPDGDSELAGGLRRSGSGNPIALLNLANILAGDLQRKDALEAYLIYALYDADSNRYEVED